MATTSGTTNFNVNLNDIAEEAYARCGAELRTGYDLATARRSLNLLTIEWANRGINLWTIEEGSVTLTPGTIEYDLPIDTIDLLDHVIRSGATTPTEVQSPRLHLFPAPDSSTTYTFVYWRMRRIQDAGDGVNTQDIPFRLIPCMVAGLAYYLSLKIPDAVTRIDMLKLAYEEQWSFASGEDREKAAIRFVPREFYLGG